jgi:hypothetical protein
MATKFALRIMPTILYFLWLVIVFGVLLPIGLRLLAIPIIHAYEHRLATEGEVAAGFSMAHEAEREAANNAPDDATLVAE